MKEPNHKVKRRREDFINDDKIHSLYVDGNNDMVIYDHFGWLGSGVVDRNGREIFEGDIIKHIIPPGYVQDDNLYIVYFRRCSFLLIAEKDWDCRENCGATPLGWKSSASIEVVGHIAEGKNYDIS